MAEIGAGNGSDYPASLDVDNTKEVNSPNPNATYVKAETPNDLAACVLAIQSTLGINPQGSAGSVVIRLNNIDTTLAASNIVYDEWRIWKEGLAKSPYTDPDDFSLHVAMQNLENQLREGIDALRNERKCWFSVRSNAGQTVNSASAADVQYDTILLDRNGDFDTSTYTFTAPETGLYQFSFVIKDSSGASAVDQDLMRARLITTGRTVQFHHSLAQSSAVDHIVGSIALPMTKNDTAKVDIARSAGTGSWSLDTTSTLFSGYLIS